MILLPRIKAAICAFTLITGITACSKQDSTSETTSQAAETSVKQVEKQAKKPPNILLIMSDDLGHDDLSLHQHPFIETPQLDNFAANAVRFTDFNVSPVCATTRASLLTGKQFYKTGVSGVHGGRDYLSLKEQLISNVLSQNGYATGTWGKWHNGKTQGYFPWDRGFDEAYYAELYRHENSFGLFNGTPVKHDKWVSEVIADYAIDFMKKNQDRPFFAFASFLAPHEPWLAPEAYTKKYQEKGLREGIAHLYGMVEEMDFHIGRMLSFLDESGLAENTIVMFMSDNGPWWGSSNYGTMTDEEWLERNPSEYKGWKARNWQNGIKSPFFVRWKGKYEKKIVDQYADVTDIVPSLLELASLESPDDLDGRSFTPMLEGKKVADERTIFIGTHDVVSKTEGFNQWTPIDEARKAQIKLEDQLVAVRNDRFKLIINPIRDKDHYPMPVDGYVLVDLVNDPKENENVYSKYPEQANALKAELERHFQEIMQYENSFETPTYFIDKSVSPVSVVNAFGPATTRGSIKSKAHVLNGLATQEDATLYKVNVKSGGEYAVYIKQRKNNNAGIETSLSIQGNTLTQTMTNDPVVYMGDVELQEGDSELTFSIAKNDIKDGSLSGLRRFLFIDKASGKTPADMTAPN